MNGTHKPECGGRGLREKLNAWEARDIARIQRRLPLGRVEVRGDTDHREGWRIHVVVTKALPRHQTKVTQDRRGDLWPFVVTSARHVKMLVTFVMETRQL